jgi:hypothetical protein
MNNYALKFKYVWTYISICNFQAEMESYGFDTEGGLPDESDEANGVFVPETICPLDVESLAIFRQNVQPVHQEDMWNVQPYLHAVRTLWSLVGDTS